jgi:putative transposase
VTKRKQFGGVQSEGRAGGDPGQHDCRLWSRYPIHRNMITKWKRDALDGMKATFAKRRRVQGLRPRNRDEGPAGEDWRALGGVGFFDTRVRSMSVKWSRQQVERDHPRLSLSRQCRLLGISRGSLYSTPRDESEENPELLRVIDAQYLKMLWYGSRQMARSLRRQDHEVGRRYVCRLVRVMELCSVAPGPNISRRCAAHPVYPYLLRDLVHRPTKPGLRCTDVTFVPMAHGLLYLVAIMDRCTRQVLSWRLPRTPTRRSGRQHWTMPSIRCAM